MNPDEKFWPGRKFVAVHAHALGRAIRHIAHEDIDAPVAVIGDEIRRDRAEDDETPVVAEARPGRGFEAHAIRFFFVRGNIHPLDGRRRRHGDVFRKLRGDRLRAEPRGGEAKQIALLRRAGRDREHAIEGRGRLTDEDHALTISPLARACSRLRPE